jgi:O-antigen/teichoic acid export membrane protein
LVDQLRSVGRWILSAQLPGLGVCLLVGDMILGLLGKGFSAGWGVLVWLAVAAVIDGTANLAQVPLFLTRPRLHFLIALATLAIHAGLSWILVPRLGLAGTGVSMAVAYGLAGGLRQLAVRRLLGRWLFDVALVKPLAAFGLALLAAYGAMRALPPEPSWRWLCCGVFFAVYTAVLAALEGDLRRRVVAAVAGRFSRP